MEGRSLKKIKSHKHTQKLKAKSLSYLLNNLHAAFIVLLKQNMKNVGTILC